MLVLDRALIILDNAVLPVVQKGEKMRMLVLTI